MKSILYTSQVSNLSSKNLSGQVVGFKQVAESENGALIRQARGACVKLGELTKQGHIVRSFRDEVLNADLFNSV